MKAIVCVDDNYGILFNNRRLSRDRSLTTWIIDYTSGAKIWMRPYSKELFEGYTNIHVSDNYLTEAATDDYSFVEDASLSDSTKNIDTILLCKWNRRYPSDIKFNKNILNANWSMSIEAEFRGTSHDKITIERWEKNVRS